MLELAESESDSDILDYHSEFHPNDLTFPALVVRPVGEEAGGSTDTEITARVTDIITHRERLYRETL